MPMTKRASSRGRKYGKLASDKVERAMHEYKRGELKSGRSGKTVKSRKQAIAIGLSEARARGGKVLKRAEGLGEPSFRERLPRRRRL